MKYLGIDFGSKKVGFAQSDDDGRLAFPLMIAPNDASLMKDTPQPNNPHNTYIKFKYNTLPHHTILHYQHHTILHHHHHTTTKQPT